VIYSKNLLVYSIYSRYSIYMYRIYSIYCIYHEIEYRIIILECITAYFKPFHFDIMVNWSVIYSIAVNTVYTVQFIQHIQYSTVRFSSYTVYTVEYILIIQYILYI